jgi:hypothetical protein
MKIKIFGRTKSILLLGWIDELVDEIVNGAERGENVRHVRPTHVHVRNYADQLRHSVGEVNHRPSKIILKKNMSIFFNSLDAKNFGTLHTPVLPPPESPQNFELGSLVLVAFFRISLHLSFFSRVISALCNILMAVSLLANKCKEIYVNNN